MGCAWATPWTRRGRWCGRGSRPWPPCCASGVCAGMDKTTRWYPCCASTGDRLDQPGPRIQPGPGHPTLGPPPATGGATATRASTAPHRRRGLASAPRQPAADLVQPVSIALPGRAGPPAPVASPDRHPVRLVSVWFRHAGPQTDTKPQRRYSAEPRACFSFGPKAGSITTRPRAVLGVVAFHGVPVCADSGGRRLLRA